MTDRENTPFIDKVLKAKNPGFLDEIERAEEEAEETTKQLMKAKQLLVDMLMYMSLDGAKEKLAEYRDVIVQKFKNFASVASESLKRWIIDNIPNFDFTTYFQTKPLTEEEQKERKEEEQKAKDEELEKKRCDEILSNADISDDLDDVGKYATCYNKEAIEQERERLKQIELKNEEEEKKRLAKHNERACESLYDTVWVMGTKNLTPDQMQEQLDIYKRNDGCKDEEGNSRPC